MAQEKCSVSSNPNLKKFLFLENAIWRLIHQDKFLVGVESFLVINLFLVLVLVICIPGKIVSFFSFLFLYCGKFREM